MYTNQEAEDIHLYKHRQGEDMSAERKKIIGEKT